MKKIIIKESSLKRLVKNLNEDYDPNRLYKKSYILDRLKNAPRQIRMYSEKLPTIECSADNWVTTDWCTTIPEVIYVYITGRY